MLIQSSDGLLYKIFLVEEKLIKEPVLLVQTAC